MKVGVLFSNGEVFAVTKPAGMVSQGAFNTKLPELWELLRHYHGDLNIVHRIDRYTSGVMLAANSRKGRGYFGKYWHSITKKVYLAIVKDPLWDSRIVDTLLDGKSAVTGFQVLDRAQGFALLRCELIQNGRTHQIRRHLKSIGSPIVGDKMYRGAWTAVRGGQLLHAWQVSVRLPGEDFKPVDEWTTFQAPIPDDFKKFAFEWDRLDAEATTIASSMEVPEGWTRPKKIKEVAVAV